MSVLKGEPRLQGLCQVHQASEFLELLRVLTFSLVGLADTMTADEDADVRDL